MIALVVPPETQDVPPEIYSPLFALGILVGLVGWILLLVMSFKTSVKWGLLVLFGPIVIDFLAGTHLWAGYPGLFITRSERALIRVR